MAVVFPAMEAEDSSLFMSETSKRGSKDPLFFGLFVVPIFLRCSQPDFLNRLSQDLNPEEDLSTRESVNRYNLESFSVPIPNT